MCKEKEEEMDHDNKEGGDGEEGRLQFYNNNIMINKKEQIKGTRTTTTT